MYRLSFYSMVLFILIVMAAAPLPATVTIKSITPSVTSPQPVGTPVTWRVTATDTNANPLTFQFNVAYGSQPFALVSDFNIGTQSGKVWLSQHFNWATIAGEGAYTIQVIAKDFVSGETATQTASYTLTSLAPVKFAVSPTSNALVALFSAPSCAAGSQMRVAYFSGTNPPNYTGFSPCNPPVSMNFYVAGMLPSTTYTMYAQVQTGSQLYNGASLPFTTGALPDLGKQHSFPTFTVKVPAGSQTDTNDGMLLWAFTGTVIPVATDLNGNINWYYGAGSATLVTRPLPDATVLTLQNGASWNSATDETLQLVREIDLAGNIVHETNTGVVAHQLAAMGAVDGLPCWNVPNPAPVGTACMNEFDHEAIRYTIGNNSYTAVLAHVERVFPAGTQGSSPTGPPLDILTEMAIVLDSNWQVAWYFDPLQQLDINRAAVLGETCANPGCAVKMLLSSVANDWTHGNTIQYQPTTGNLLVSLRDQDWVVNVNYDNGAGAGNVLWRMGPDGDFTIVAPKGDTWPWFSHQHDAGFANNGSGPFVVFDNGNTRVSPPPLGTGSGASRGMSLTVNQTTMQVTPVVSAALGTYSSALGSAQLLSDGLYMFQPGIPGAISIEIDPTAGSLTGPQVLKIQSPTASYRSWQMPNLYSPPSW